MNKDIINNSIEEDLLEIKKCKLRILLLMEKNDELCKQNNEEIERLNKVIESRLIRAEETLRKSGKRKIDTPTGWVAYRNMPDRWEYDEPTIINWCKENNQPYYHVEEILDKLKLKNAINNNKIRLNRPEDIPGLKVTAQEPKFKYKIKDLYNRFWGYSDDYKY